MSKLTKRIIIGAVVVIVGLIAWRFFVVSPPEEALEGISTSRQTVGRELLVLLSTLRSLTLEDQVLNDPEFMSLRDSSVPIEPNPLGRRNPFAPIGIGNVEDTTLLPDEAPTDDVGAEDSATTTPETDEEADI